MLLCHLEKWMTGVLGVLWQALRKEYISCNKVFPIFLQQDILCFKMQDSINSSVIQPGLRILSSIENRVMKIFGSNSWRLEEQCRCISDILSGFSNPFPSSCLFWTERTPKYQGGWVGEMSPRVKQCKKVLSILSPPRLHMWESGNISYFMFQHLTHAQVYTAGTCLTLPKLL